MRALRSLRGFSARAAGFSACVRMPSATRYLAFGMSAGAAPDRFLVGLAVLGLLVTGGSRTTGAVRGR